jgi:hypothetical protein
LSKSKRGKHLINIELLNGANYYEKKVIKRMLRYYYRLREHAMWRGDYIALSVWIDINTALWHPEVLTDKQRQCVIGVYVNGYAEWEIGEMTGTSQQAVHKNLEKAIRRIQVALLTGNLYKQSKVNNVDKGLFFGSRSYVLGERVYSNNPLEMCM